MPVSLKGAVAPDLADRIVNTSAAKVTFGHKTGLRGVGTVPGIIAEKRTFLDAAPKDVRLADAALAAITSVAELEKAVQKLLADEAKYAEAQELTEKNAALAVSSLRKAAMFKALAGSLDKTKIPSGEMGAARTALKMLELESFMNKDIKFDIVKHDTYHPYDKPFDAGVRKLLDVVTDKEERAKIEGILNYITDKKTSKGWGSIDERNIESSIGLRVIDRGSGGAAVSLAKSSSDPFSPKYVVLTVKKTGLPAELKKYAGLGVVRDGAALVFDKTADKVPAALEKHITEKAASAQLGLRLMEPKEKPRQNLPYDWNGNGSIEPDPIDISWWGHCHIEAALASLGLKASSGVTLYNAASGKETKLSASDVNDLIFALFDCDSYSSMSGYGRASPGIEKFAANRNDTTDGPRYADDIVFKLANGSEKKFSVRFDKLYDDKDKELDYASVFQPTAVLDGGIKFGPNPLYKGAAQADWSKIDGDRKMELSIEFLDVSDTGEVKRDYRNIKLDPKNPAAEPTLIGSELTPGYPPGVTKFYLDQKTGKLEEREYDVVAKDNGKYEQKEVRKRDLGAIKGKTLMRELTREGIIPIHDMLMQAIREGAPFVTEKTPGQAVWNYATDGIRINVDKKDGEFVKYTTTLNTQGGAMTFSYILKYDKDGKAVDAHALSDPPDFLWSMVRNVAMPLFKDGGSVVVNAAAAERGALLDSKTRKITDKSLAFFRYAADVVYAALQDSKKAERFVIRGDDGKLYLYDSKTEFDADVAAAKPQRVVA